MSLFSGLCPFVQNKYTGHSTKWSHLYDMIFFIRWHGNKNSPLNRDNPLNRRKLNRETTYLITIEEHKLSLGEDSGLIFLLSSVLTQM